jgi:hypothetical protein
VAERQRRSNDGEALVAGDDVPGVLQLEEGKGGCEARLQRGKMAARGGEGRPMRRCHVAGEGRERERGGGGRGPHDRCLSGSGPRPTSTGGVAWRDRSKHWEGADRWGTTTVSGGCAS